MITTPGSATMTLLHRARKLLTQDPSFHTFRAVSNNFYRKVNPMKTQRILIGLLVGSLLLLSISVFAQMNRPYRNGSVWELAFVRMKPGMESTYLKYVATDWKKEQEALKAEGLVLSYKVVETEGHTPGDWNLILMTEFKDLASLEANDAKAEAVTQRVVGNDEKQAQGYRDRGEIREVMGTRLAREIILEPRR